MKHKKTSGEAANWVQWSTSVQIPFTRNSSDEGGESLTIRSDLAENVNNHGGSTRLDRGGNSKKSPLFTVKKLCRRQGRTLATFLSFTCSTLQKSPAYTLHRWRGPTQEEVRFIHTRVAVLQKNLADFSFRNTKTSVFFFVCLFVFLLFFLLLLLLLLINYT